MSVDESDDRHERFSVVVGGPFHAVLGRLRLLGTNRLPAPRAAVALTLLAWLPPALLAIAQSLIDDRYSAWADYFKDVTVYARFLVAIGMMIAIENYADGRMGLLIRHFRAAGLIAEAGLPAYSDALATADRRSSSALAEALILAVAFILPGLGAGYVVSIAGSTWEGTMAGSEVVLSWAGKFTRFVSTPLFIFLVLRWSWRFLVWSVLLFRVSRLPLQLTPLHPDRSAGLGFLTIYSNVFSGFVFALSCVVASIFMRELSYVQHSAQPVGIAMVAWLCMVFICFVGPLLVFAGPLYQVRERALLQYGRLTTQHHLTVDRKWIGEGKSGADLVGSPDPSSTSDLNASVEVTLQLHLIPDNRFALIQILAAAGIPFLAVVATQTELLEAAKWIIGALL